MYSHLKLIEDTEDAKERLQRSFHSAPELEKNDRSSAESFLGCPETSRKTERFHYGHEITPPMIVSLVIR
ncbi:MAG TPA: hypothetical protein VE860_20040 [Chthoniobacterales bacterium]|jgi:hypothetical protein|nr:hypothetical protein [Chthoniobacterales bacterium]